MKQTNSLNNSLPQFIFTLLKPYKTYLGLMAFIALLFLKPIQALSHAFAVSKTEVVGKMVDSISKEG